ncbi:CPBP family intramembrane glutamic endopeptidase [Pseudalkalibacillus decolorationis]|uniref:CPBP family intramembrane glutamic endopeptidase n=1 Tax=Pseudalkalibacillus decolorationis TaxID=163879 RepID=UPI002147662A|nr:type II CAAX endopeptidase family protein [Pseudalkalibacillus decolorationis]
MLNPKKQQQIIASISQKELYINLYVTQAIFLGIALILSIVFDQDYHDWKSMIRFNPLMILVWSVPAALLVIVCDLIIWSYLPFNWVDDGGINERIFSTISIFHLAFLAFVIAVSEEILFRGVLQENIGYLTASVLFALMHIRYLLKPVLLTVAIILSFMLGALFLWTDNLLIPILVHFLIDFILGLMIRFNWLVLSKKRNRQMRGEG